MAATTAARSAFLVRPTFGSPYLSRLSSGSSRPLGSWQLLPVRWLILPEATSTSFPLNSIPFNVNSSSYLAMPCFLSAFGQNLPRDHAHLVAKLSTSALSSPYSNAVRSSVPEAIAGQNPHSSDIRSPKAAEPAVSELVMGSRNSSSSKKSKRMCYYHSQGLCTMMEDPVHLAKYNHEFPDLSVRDEDLKKLKAQPFDYFLVLDLEGMVEILEFPVLMIDAKTLQVVDHFHRFVRPAKMTSERLKDYIKNKYGRWGLDRVWHDTAIPFVDVLRVFEGWLESHGLWDPTSNEMMKTAAFVTCGNWDVKTKIPEQCVTSEINLPIYFNEWINLKDIYFNFYKFKATGMLPMLKGLKLPLVGTHHVGLDDALNISRVLQRMLSQGALVQITARRKADDPKAVKFTFRFRIK